MKSYFVAIVIVFFVCLEGSDTREEIGNLAPVKYLACIEQAETDGEYYLCERNYLPITEWSEQTRQFWSDVDEDNFYRMLKAHTMVEVDEAGNMTLVFEYGYAFDDLSYSNIEIDLNMVDEVYGEKTYYNLD